MADSVTQVVNIRHESCDVYCGRGSKLGNIFMVPGGNRTVAIRRFMTSFKSRVEFEPDFRAYVLSLKGKKLGCHCHPLKCHLDYVAEWIEEQSK